MPLVHVHPEVADAIQRGAAVVALESAVITSGLPRESLPATSRLRVDQWNRNDPVNLELALAMQRTVREQGAVPAMIAVINGELRIGLNDADVKSLATDSTAGKASVTDLAHLLVTNGTAGTTVSATLAACSAACSALSTPHSALSVFATGGIGGVHRDWQNHPDISADLRIIANTPICVVCSGAKSILDLPATLEMLESLGVPVFGWRTNQFPQFFSGGTDELRLTKRVDSIDEAAAMCDLHWNTLHRREGILLCNPPPEEFAIDANEVEVAIAQAEEIAAKRGIRGAARTPFLLSELARLTQGRSLDANLALLLDNARLAAELALAIATPDANT